MKIVYMQENGDAQIVITPESPADKAMLDLVNEKSTLVLHSGSFYDCQGGWMRQRTEHDSLIITIKGDK